MPKYVSSELDILTKEGQSMGYAGTKQIIITKPHDNFTERLIGFGLQQFSSNATIAQDQLKRINEKLHDRLPYLGESSYDAFAQLEDTRQLNRWGSHFIQTRGTKTLEARTEDENIESIEQSLALKELLFSHWDAYQLTLPDRLSRHVILAKEHTDSGKMMIINPSYKATHTNPFGAEFIQDSQIFGEYFQKMKYKTVRE